MEQATKEYVSSAVEEVKTKFVNLTRDLEKGDKKTLEDIFEAIWLPFVNTPEDKPEQRKIEIKQQQDSLFYNIWSELGSPMIDDFGGRFFKELLELEAGREYVIKLILKFAQNHLYYYLDMIET